MVRLVCWFCGCGYPRQGTPLVFLLVQVYFWNEFFVWSLKKCKFYIGHDSFQLLVTSLLHGCKKNFLCI